mmetsp:Transcript_3981/g.5737  ORF Transcript_3981/g.5737 Transcript_3981/m.5737 type:complete len:206 (-) Transcript_3981:152-769(-)
MGKRFNVLMTIQIPLEQKLKKKVFYRGLLWSYDCDGGGLSPCEYSCEEDEEEEEEDSCSYEEDEEDACVEFFECKTKRSASRGRSSAKLGTSNAARVSRGSYVDSWDGLTVKSPKHHPSEHVTVTIVMYYTCSGGVPSAEDVQAAVDDLENMYRSVESGKLADSTFNFMKSPLTPKDMTDIKTKLVTQPPPKLQAPINYDVFPVS